MNYYETIKQEFISNEIYKRVKDYSKNQNDLKTYYNVGKMLCEAGKHYGEGIIREYSKKLTVELGRNYDETTLKRMRQFYLLIEKGATLWHQLTWSHYRELLKFDDIQLVNYYIKIVEEQNLSVRELRERIKSKEYERLDDKTKLKLKNQKNLEIKDFIKNPIILKTNQEILKERALQQLILEDLPSFMKELGPGFSFIENEHKIKIGNVYNYIDLLLFNYIYQCFVVVELKVTELKKEHIGQIETYMHYIDKNLKTNNQDKTIGIILTKKDNRFIMEYCSDKKVLNITYSLQHI